MPYCPYCNALVYDAATRCYSCGALLSMRGPLPTSPLDPSVRLERWRRGRIYSFCFSLSAAGASMLGLFLSFSELTLHCGLSVSPPVHCCNRVASITTMAAQPLARSARSSAGLRPSLVAPVSFVC
jgi:hypothetical protein